MLLILNLKIIVMKNVNVIIIKMNLENMYARKIKFALNILII